MDNTLGLHLIEELKRNPEQFRKDGNSYQLLQEYLGGFPKDTLYDLLQYKDKYIRQVVLWIITELGEECKELLKDVSCQIDDEDPIIFYYSAEIIANYATDEFMDDFMKVFAFLEHTNQRIRSLAMFIISKLSESRIRKAYFYSLNSNVLSSVQKKGIITLMNYNTIPVSGIYEMINSSDSVIRKYGVIIASKVYELHPEIIKSSVASDDLDVKEFSEYEIRGKEILSKKTIRNRKK